MKPVITYTNVQQVYPLNVQIPQLTPANTGGVPTQVKTVSTISGATNNMIYPVDGTAELTTYKFPISVTIKSDGTLAVIDDVAPIVRVVTPQGVSSTIAGKFENINGKITLGYVDAQGANAKFKKLKGVAFDKNGNIFVADNTNARLRKIDPQGNVTTFSGSGIFDISDGDKNNACFSSIRCLWIDNNGNIFATDDSSVRKIDLQGNVTTIAGSSTKGNINTNGLNARFKTLRGITGDNQGNLYVTDPDNQSIRKIDANSNVTTLATGITGAGIAFYNNTLYVADWMKNQIKTVDINTGVITVYCGSGIGQYGDGFDTRDQFGASFYNPEGLAIDTKGDIYVADRSSMKIRKITTQPAFTISPALPKGLSIDANTGIISGTPTVAIPTTGYTITANNYDGVSTTNIYLSVQ